MNQFVNAKYGIGQIIQHNKFNYRGVIFDVDAEFQGTDEWYDAVAKSRPPKDQPWYSVMVDGSDITSYVAERHLQIDHTQAEIQHPLITIYFDGFVDGHYSLSTKRS